VAEYLRGARLAEAWWTRKKEIGAKLSRCNELPELLAYKVRHNEVTDPRGAKFFDPLNVARVGGEATSRLPFALNHRGLDRGDSLGGVRHRLGADVGLVLCGRLLIATVMFSVVFITMTLAAMIAALFMVAADLVLVGGHPVDFAAVFIGPLIAVIVTTSTVICHLPVRLTSSLRL
jgi:hypothetical protein